MTDICAVCGEVIPEGRQICWICERCPRFAKRSQAVSYARIKGWACYEIYRANGLYHVREKEGANENDCE